MCTIDSGRYINEDDGGDVLGDAGMFVVHLEVADGDRAVNLDTEDGVVHLEDGRAWGSAPRHCGGLQRVFGDYSAFSRVINKNSPLLAVMSKIAYRINRRATHSQIRPLGGRTPLVTPRVKYWCPGGRICLCHTTRGQKYLHHAPRAWFSSRRATWCIRCPGGRNLPLCGPETRCSPA